MRRERISALRQVTTLEIPYTTTPKALRFAERLVDWLNGGEFVNEGSVSFNYSPPSRAESAACRKEVLEQVLPVFLREVNSSQGRLKPLQHLLDTLTLSLHPRSGGRVRPVFTGSKALVGWSTLMLFGLLEQEKLDRIALCACGCGRWFIKWRRDRRSATNSCRVRINQSSEKFKTKRNARDRQNRWLHKNGKVVVKHRKKQSKKS